MHTTSSARADASAVAAALIGVMLGLKARMARAGLDAGPFILLHRVSEQSPIRVSDLAACVGLDASTVSRHVKSLEEEGFIARSSDPQDGRASRVDLTEAGRAHLTRYHAMRADLVADALADWSAEDRQQLMRLTTRLAAAVAPAPATAVPSQTPTENS